MIVVQGVGEFAVVDLVVFVHVGRTVGRVDHHLALGDSDSKRR